MLLAHSAVRKQSQILYSFLQALVSKVFWSYSTLKCIFSCSMWSKSHTHVAPWNRYFRMLPRSSNRYFRFSMLSLNRIRSSLDHIWEPLGCTNCTFPAKVNFAILQNFLTKMARRQDLPTHQPQAHIMRMMLSPMSKMPLQQAIGRMGTMDFMPPSPDDSSLWDNQELYGENQATQKHNIFWPVCGCCCFCTSFFEQWLLGLCCCCVAVFIVGCFLAWAMLICCCYCCCFCSETRSLCHCAVWWLQRNDDVGLLFVNYELFGFALSYCLLVANAVGITVLLLGNVCFCCWWWLWSYRSNMI